MCVAAAEYVPAQREGNSANLSDTARQMLRAAGIILVCSPTIGSEIVVPSGR
jgi:hypothetical protein